MSSVDQLLGDLKAKGIELWVEADRLRFRAPEGAMTPDVRDAVAAAKPALIAALRSAAREQLRTAPLSYNQQALFFLNQHAPESAAYNIGFAIRIKSAVNHDALSHAVQALVDRHDTLRTTYELRDTGPVQIIAGSAAVPVTVVNAAGLTESELSDRVHDAFRAPFDLKAGPVVRFHLFTLNPREHVLLGSVHHIAADGWSIWILLDELRQLYAAHATGQPATMRRAATTYLDFVESQKASVESADGQAMWDYWRGQLAGELPALDLPGDRPRPRVMRYVGDTIEVSLPEAVVSGVKRVAREQGTTAFAVLLAAFNAVMARYTGKSDVIVGTPVFGRSHAEFQSVVGDFVNSVVLRSQVAGERTFREHVGEASGTVRNAIENGECPFPMIVQRLGVQRDPARPPIFQVMLILQKPHRSSDFARLFTPGGGAIDFGGLHAEGYSLAHQEGQVDLTLELAESGASIVGGLKYNTDLFDRSSARRLRDHFARLLTIAVEHPEERIDQLAGRMLADDERSLMLDTWNATTRDIPAADPARLFDQQAARRPDAIAIEAVDGSLTYAELEARSNRLAHRLRTLGVGPGGLVGIGLNRTQHLPIAVLGVLKSGAAYVPLDPSFPTQRLAWMLEDAAPPVLITEQALAGTWPVSGATLLCLDDASLGLENEPASAPAQAADDDDLAYVIFTSGSTGRPKGVEIPRIAVTNFLESMAREPGCGPEDRLLAVTTLSFDIAVLELLLPLVTGGTVVLATREDAVDGERLRAMIASRRITLMQATPATWRMLGDAGWTGTPGLTVLCGGEALPADLAERLIDQASVVWNMYGPTETTVWSTLGRVSRGAAITIGRPIANTRIYVLGPERAPLPIGVTGELWIGGAGLARGYLGQSDLTNERFVPDPFVAGGRMYRTGDLARWTASGELEHLGRVDAQVKVRGFRIELGDVEAALSAAVDGALAAVAAVSTAGDTRLVGCVVSASIDGAAIRQALRATLPEYMVPSAIVSVDALPRTANGKLDRRALAGIAEAASSSARAVEGETPTTETEQVVAAIWGELLHVANVARDDSFFELGGHSLLATQLMSRVRERFGVELPLRTLFQCPTLRGFASEIDVAAGADASRRAGSIPVASRTSPLPLTFSQERLWFLAQLDPQNTAYSIPLALRLTGPLDVTALEQSCRDLVEHHEALRTRFDSTEGRPTQVIGPTWEQILVDHDCGDAGWDAAVLQATNEARRPFDLTTGPLIRFVLYRVSATEHLFLINVHHIVADQWSLGILSSDLSRCYEARLAGRVPEFTATPVQFADFAAWQRAVENDDVIQSQLAYWKKNLAGVEPLTLLVDQPSRAEVTAPSDVVTRSLPAGLLARVRAISVREGVTLSMLLLAAFLLVLRRHTLRDDLAIGIPVANRRRQDVEQLVGMFINMLVVRTDLAGSPSLRGLLHRVRGTTLEAYERQDVPFEQLVAALHPAREQGRSPLVQVVFNVLNTPAQSPTLQQVAVAPVVLQRNEPQIELNWTVEPDVTQSIYVEYDASLYRRRTIERMLEHFHCALEALVDDLEVPVDKVHLLPAGERRQLIEAFNQTDASYPSTVGVAESFETIAAASPRRVAVLHGGAAISYEELNARANQIAHRLRALGVGPDTLVGVGLHRTPDLVATLLGVLKAGGAYLPLDPAFPAERLAWILEDAQPSVIVTDRGLAPTWPVTTARVLCLDDESEGWAGQPAHNLASTASPDSLAYVIFTSGSTGRPKGVQISRRAVTNFLTSMRREPGLGPDDRLLAVTTLSFDIAVLELFLPLTTGAAVVLATREDATDAQRLLALMAAHNVTVMQATPATWRMLIDADWRNPRMRVLCGGEPLAPELAAGLLERAGELWNLYGPTETTVWSTLSRVYPDQAITIGRPIANTQIYILGPAREVLPVGVAGELWIGGDGVARGYHGRPDLTAERFVENPFAPGRIYRTGDVARWNEDGTLDHLGRTDDQVKVRGFRIELGDVEHALAIYPGARQAAVIAYGSGADTRLVAFVVPAGEPVDTAAVRQFARQRLPEYMVPSAILSIDVLPQTANGKLDRRALAVSARALLSAHSAANTSTAGSVPASPMEDMLMAIWADVLGVDRVRRDDDFFDLGGHSLLATRLMKQLSDVFWVDLSVRTLFEAPTVAAMAAVVVDRMEAKRQQEARPVATVAEINPHGSRPPFFFLHAAMQGDGFYCYNLARHLGEDQPMYALPPLGLDGGAVPPTIPAMAAAQRQVIRRIQPSGPYFLGGFCFAGGVALEVARQLRAEGERVELVVAIETRIHPPILLNRAANSMASWAGTVRGWSPHQQAAVAGRLRPFVYALARLYYSDKEQLKKRIRTGLREIRAIGIRTTVRNFVNPRRPAVAPAPTPVVDQVRSSVMRANEIAFNGYVPGRYDGRIECMWAEAEPFEPRTWEMLGPQVQFTPVPGNHNTCVTTQVASLSAPLARALRSAQEAASVVADPKQADSHETAARWSLLKFRRSTADIANAAKPDARSGRASIVARSTKATAR